MRFLGVFSPSEGTAWNLAGKPIEPRPKLPYLDRFIGPFDSSAYVGSRLLAFQTSGREVPSAVIEIAGVRNPAGFTSPHALEWQFGTELKVEGRANISLRIGVATGAWKRILQHKPSEPVFEVEQTPTEKVDYKLPDNQGVHEAFFVRLPRSKSMLRNEIAYRLVAFDKSGSAMGGSGQAKLQAEIPIERFYFAGNVSDIGRIELQTRPYVWFDLPPVPLKP